MKQNHKPLLGVLKIITCVLSLEAVAMAIWGILLTVVALQSGEVNIAASLAFGIFYLLVAASLVLAVRAVVQGKRFGRSLAIVWQLFAVIIGLQVNNAGAILGLVATAAGGLVLILFFTKPALAHFEEEPGKPVPPSR